MGSLLTARVSVEGVRPLLWHAFGPDSMPVEKREKTGVAGNDPQEWKRSVLMTAERQLYLRPSYIYGCLRDAARYTSRKRGTLMPSLAGTLQPADPIILIDRFVPDEPLPTDPNEPVYLDICGVKNPATKGRNVRYRVAAAPGWHLTFNILWSKLIVSRDEMRKVIDDGGMLVGLGDGRGIGNGRYQVLECEFADA